MKKILTRVIVLVIVLGLAAPSLLSVASLAADESGTASEANIWDSLDPAYMKATFSTVSERILGNDVIGGMKLSLVSNGYALYYDENDGEVICLKLKAADADGNYSMTNGVYDYDGYYSTNPVNVGSSKSATNSDTTSSVKQTLLSQLLIKYTENDTESTLSSYKDAALNDQITIQQIRGGLRVEYTLGREEVKYLAPRQIRIDKWFELLRQVAMNSSGIKERKNFFSYYSTKAISDDQIVYNFTSDDLPTQDVKNYFFMTRAEFSLQYPNDKSGYGISYGIIPQMVSNIRSQSEATTQDNLTKFPVTNNFAIMVFDSTAKAAEIRKVEQIVKLYTDYTYEQMEEDHSETDYTGTDKIPALFKMAIEYTLDNYGLNIRLNAGNIRFDNSNYKLSNISFLPYAGAADTNNSGYLLSPDGSGSLISFADIKGTQFTTTSKIYGQDYAFHTITGANKEVIRLPVFGSVETSTVKEEYQEIQVTVDPETGEEKQEEVTSTRDVVTAHGFFSIITSGESLASLTIENGGSLHMFAAAYTSFNPRPKDSYVLDGGISAGTDAMWTVESKRKYTGDYSMKIFILDNETSSYVGMANVYRNYLIDTGVLVKQEDTQTDIPLYLQTLGALETTKTILGIPVDTIVPLTSFQDTINILKTLQEANITNVKINMMGIANKGMFAQVPNHFEVVDELGGKEDLRQLVAFAAESGATLFPNFDFATAIRDDLFDGFTSDDMAKTIDNRSATMKEYDPVWQGYQNGTLGIISANAMNKFYENFYKEYQDYNVGGIAVTTLGQYLTSDFNEDDPLNREDSKTLVKKLLKKISEQNSKVMVSGGNAYTLPYVTDIVDVPLEDSRYKYSSATIPFYGMVLHGFKDFSGSPINLAGDYQYTMLKTIENGASPYFVIAVENTSELKQYSSYSSLNQYYSVKYSIWLLDMVETYQTINNALKQVKDSIVTAHEFLDSSNKVVKVAYDNGVVFYINYTQNDFTTEDGVTIPSQNFVTVTK